MKAVSAGTVALALAIATPHLLSQSIAPSTVPPSDAGAASASASPAVSQVRIVRLSQVNGNVEMDRNTGHGYEPAMPNLPIVQGAKLRTREGVAEVELEDNSSVRLGLGSAVEFPQLGRASSGATLSTLHVVSGTVYVSMASTKGNDFHLSFDGKDLRLMPSSHVRLSSGKGETRFAVLEGMAEVTGASGGMSVGKKTTLVYSDASASTPVLVRNTESAPLDEWDKTAVEYHRRISSGFAGGGSGQAYGQNDMNYYGSFADLPGCGSVWRPYFASAAWDPFGNGAWAWYQGAGYSWVSPYPWGWTPFHSGEWQQCGDRGWGWRPNGVWNGLQNQSLLLRQKPGRAGLPRPDVPAAAPAPGQPTLHVVNLRPQPVSSHAGGENFVFRNDSAGLGIPRGTFGKLGGTSTTVAQHGSVSVPAASYSPSASHAGNAYVPAVQGGRSGTPMQPGHSVSAPAAPMAGSTGGRSSSAGGASAGAGTHR